MLQWALSHITDLSESIIALVTLLGGFGGLWRAIKKKFLETQKERTAQLIVIAQQMQEAFRMHTEQTQRAFDVHEALDQQRHTDNKSLIKDLTHEVNQQGKALAALGWRNGTGHVAGEDVKPPRELPKPSS